MSIRAVLRDGCACCLRKEPTSRPPAVALGDREAVLRLHREGRLPNEIHIFRGGLLGIAVRMNRPDMIATLLDLGLDPNAAWLGLPVGTNQAGPIVPGARCDALEADAERWAMPLAWATKWCITRLLSCSVRTARGT